MHLLTLSNIVLIFKGRTLVVRSLSFPHSECEYWDFREVTVETKDIIEDKRNTYSYNQSKFTQIRIINYIGLEC